MPIFINDTFQHITFIITRPIYFIYFQIVMPKSVKFLEAPEGDLRLEIKNLRSENAKLSKQDQENKNLISKLNGDFKQLKDEIKTAAEHKTTVNALRKDILNSENNFNLLKHELSEAKHKEIRLRATLELQSTQLVLENVKNKQLIVALEGMTKQIERQGTTEKEKSFIYNQMKLAFLEKWNATKAETKSSKVSGATVERSIKSLISNRYIDLPERDSEREASLLGKVQDGIVSLVGRAQSIISLVISQHSQFPDEEEILITVKRKRGNSSPYYQISSTSLAVQSPPTDEPTDVGPGGLIDGSLDAGSGELSAGAGEHSTTGLNIDFSESISRFLAEYRNAESTSTAD